MSRSLGDIIDELRSNVSESRSSSLLLDKIYKKIVIRSGKKKKKWKTDREGYKIQIDKNGIPHEVKVTAKETINRKLGQKTGKLKRSSQKTKSNARRALSKSLGDKLKINRKDKGSSLHRYAYSYTDDIDLSSMTDGGYDFIEVDSLEESMFRKKMIRDGKVTYKWKTSKPGINKIQYVNGVPREVKMSAEEIRHRKSGGGENAVPGTRGQVSGKMKRKGKASTIQSKRLASMKARRSNGLSHYNKVFPDINSEHDDSSI